MLCVLAFVLVNRAHSVSPVYGVSPSSSSRFQDTKLRKEVDLLEVRMSYSNEINPLYATPFMTRELKKGIYNRTRLKKRYNRNPTKENELSFKRLRNQCVALRNKAIKQHFKKTAEAGIVSNRAFWNLVKPFLSDIGGIAGNDISLVKNNRIVTENKELVEIFGDHYINIVEKSSG